MNSRLKELFILHFLNDGVRTTIITLLPFIATELSLSLTQVGFIGSSQPLLGALLALPTGYIIGRFGANQVIFTLLLIYSLSILGIAFAFNANLIFILYFAAAIGFGMFHTVGFVLTAKNSASETVGRTMGNFTSIGEIGRVAMPPLAVFLTSLIGWRVTFGSLGLLGFLLFIISRFLPSPKDTTSSKQPSPGKRAFIKDLFFLFRNKKAALVTLAAIIDSLASSPIYVFLPFLLLTKGISVQELSLAMGAYFLGSLFGKTLLGLGVDKLGNTKVFIASEICMAASLLLITHSSHYLLLLFFAILLGMFTKGTSPVVQTLFTGLTKSEHYHKVFAVSELVIGLAAVTTITLFGSLADTVGLSFVFYAAAFLALLATLPIIFYSKIRS